jgi:hypothetical protein
LTACPSEIAFGQILCFYNPKMDQKLFTFAKLRTFPNVEYDHPFWKVSTSIMDPKIILVPVSSLSRYLVITKSEEDRSMYFLNSKVCLSTYPWNLYSHVKLGYIPPNK